MKPWLWPLSRWAAIWVWAVASVLLVVAGDAVWHHVLVPWLAWPGGPWSPPAPSPLWQACSSLARQAPLSHVSTGACYRCESHGSQYLWFMTQSAWQCNDPRW